MKWPRELKCRHKPHDYDFDRKSYLIDIELEQQRNEMNNTHADHAPLQRKTLVLVQQALKSTQSLFSRF